MSLQEQHLLQLFQRLDDSAQRLLSEFAEFLCARRPPLLHDTSPNRPVTAAAMNPLPRPPNESVIAALKRLRVSYPMISRSQILEETSELVSQHVMQGRPAREVIDALEQVFARRYQALAEVAPPSPPTG